MNKNNYISIAKGIGIALMVIGHCGAPSTIIKLIYLFHMPLFFFCSGFFAKDIDSMSMLLSSFKKRFKRIYIRFIIWSFIFLLLHNLFYHLNIYNHIYISQEPSSHLYSINDYIYKAVKIIFCMNEHEQLIKSFWFLKQLLISAIIVSTIIYINKKFLQYKHALSVIFFILILITIFTKLYNLTLPAIWDISLVFMSSSFYLSGYLCKKYNIIEKLRNTYSTIFLITVLGCGLHFLPWTNMLEYTGITCIPFFATAYSGTFIIILISQKIEHYSIKYPLYYLGRNTLVILALHMLCFKIVNLIKIELYDMPIHRLAEFQIIYEHNTFFWIIYTIIGITVPLTIDYIMKHTKFTTSVWSLFV